MRRILSLLMAVMSLGLFSVSSQVTWSYDIKDDKTDHPSLELVANIAPGYHLYAMDTEAGMPLEFFFSYKGVKANGSITADKKYTTAYNDIFESDEHYYSGKVVFVQKLTPIDEKFNVSVEIKGQVCNDQSCVQINDSHKFTGTAVIKGDAEESKDDVEKMDTAEELTSIINVDSLSSVNTSTAISNEGKIVSDSWWNNVESELKALGDSPEQETRSLWYIFIAGFIGGLIALVTPCVWPLIPMTVSFFLKQNKTRRKAIYSAIIYGVSIIVIYVSLGLLVTIVFGASALNDLATSAGFNIAFFIILVIFAISFMGGFELTLPSSWSNKIDSKVDNTTGFLSIFFMAFTLALVSFSCTGPIIGTLLVEAATTSNYVSPAIGMFGFALALALPFSLFAIFPTMLKSLPKSGGWMNTVKVVLGFLELALALKFLSVADLAYGWRILDREVFVALWIVIFALLGVYLLGKITFPHDSKVERVGITRFMLAVISLSFAVYMLPGLWGAPLKSISAFTPPMSTQDFNLYDGSVHAQVNDFDEGMRLAEKLNKPVLVDFSGYGCVNCRKMEAAVWTDPAVKSKIDDDFVLVTLMVDDKNPLPQPIKVKESDGKERTLRTYGDKWSYLERTKFGATAQPYHVVLDKDAKPLSGPFVYKEDVPGYLEFLNKGLKRYNGK